MDFRIEDCSDFQKNDSYSMYITKYLQQGLMQHPKIKHATILENMSMHMKKAIFTYNFVSQKFRLDFGTK